MMARLCRTLAIVLVLLPGLVHAQVSADTTTGVRTITSATSGDVILGPLSARGSGSVQLYGTWTGTYVIEGSNSNNCTTGTYATLPGTSELTSNGLTKIDVSAVRCIRINDSGWSSGTTSVIIAASSAGGGGGGGSVASGTVAISQTGNENAVDVLTSGLPAGASTAANQTSEIALITDIETDIDDIETLLTTIAGDTTDIEAALEAIHFVDDEDFSDGVSAFALVGCVAEATPTTVTDGDVGACAMTVGRAVKVALANADGSLVSLFSSVNSSEYYISAGATEDENEVDANAGTMLSIVARNNHASANAFIRCTDDDAAGSAPATAVVIYELMVPFGLPTRDDNIGIPYSTALTCWIVLGEADDDVAEVAANDVVYVLRYQ